MSDQVSILVGQNRNVVRRLLFIIIIIIIIIIINFF